MKGGWKDSLRKLSFNYVPKEDFDEPVPERGLARFWFILGSHYLKLMLLSLVFCLTALPIITIPAASGGVCHVATELVRKGYTQDWLKSYFAGFKTSFLDRLILGAATLSGACLVSMAVLKAGMAEAPAYGVGIAVFLLLNCVWHYFLVLDDSIDLTTGQNLKNAVILMLLHPKETAILLLISALEGLFLWFGYPYCVPVMAFFGFGVIWAFMANLIWPLALDSIVRKDSAGQGGESV